MKMFGWAILMISHFFLQEFTAQYYNIGPLPAHYYDPKSCDEPIEESVPEYLETCGYFPDNNCVANLSTPYMYWLKCIEKENLLSFSASYCDEIYNLTPCNRTFDDPGLIIYEPLYHPDEKVRTYPEIFDEIRNLRRNYVKAYVNALTKTFTGQFATQYNYQWKNEQNEE